MSTWEIVASCVVCLLVGLIAGGVISDRVQSARESAIFRRLKKAFSPTPLEEAVKKADSYRGKVLSLDDSDNYGGEGTGIKVHQLAPVNRDAVILPAETLELIERNVLQFAAVRSRLSQLKQSTKKGLLLHGPPGNGKTFTIRYLIGALADHTTLLITGAQVAKLEEYMALARLLQPAFMVFEDIDLVAKERVTSGMSCEEPLLNKLLNEMDGLASDAEIIFLLTTNRPELLEEALAARPGRIDQAIEFTPPSDAERERLARLYAAGVALAPQVVEQTVAMTPGASGAFIKELMRRSLQFHLARCNDAAVDIRDVQEAYNELALNQNRIGTCVIGYSAPANHSYSFDGPG